MKNIEQVYGYAKNLLLDNKMSRYEVNMALINEGIDKDKSLIIIENIEKEYNKDQKEQANKDMIYGGLWCIGGIIMTMNDISHIFWGAILFGGYKFISGLVNFGSNTKLYDIQTNISLSKEFVEFKKFNSQISALEFVGLLNEASIEYILEDVSFSYDATGSTGLIEEFLVKVRNKDLKIVDNLIQVDILSQIEVVDKDYYLFSFTEIELENLISNSEEWSKFDFLLAKKILKERGINLRK